MFDILVGETAIYNSVFGLPFAICQLLKNCVHLKSLFIYPQGKVVVGCWASNVVLKTSLVSGFQPGTLALALVQEQEQMIL